MRKPFATEYSRWRHLTRGYIVEIVNIINHQGADGHYYPQVIVQGSKTKTAWSAEVFRKTFKPIGKKRKPLTALDRLLKDSDL